MRTFKNAVDQNKEKQVKKLMLILLMMAGLMAGCGSEPATPKEISKAYIEACLKGNLDEANSYFSKRASAFVKESLYDKINGYVKHIDDIDKFEYKFVKKYEEKNSKRIYIYMINSTAKDNLFKDYKKEWDYIKGKTSKKLSPNLVFYFIFENEKWKIKTGY